MITDAVDFIWQVIRESERSDESYSSNDQTSKKAEVERIMQSLRLQSEAAVAHLPADPAIRPAHTA